MLHQLNPTLPVICNKGTGQAHFVIDYGIEHHLMWVIVSDKDGGIWTISNPDVKVQYNFTIGRNSK